MSDSRYSFCAALLGLAGFAASAAEEPRSPGSAHLSLISPLDYQVVQRASRAEGKISIAGRITLADVKSAANPADAPDAVEVRLTGKSTVGDLPGQWQPLTFDAAAVTFRGELTVASGGWYRLEIRALHKGAELDRTTVEHIGVGEVFVVAGQSNAANHGEDRQKSASDMVAAFDGSTWRLANDPQPGASGSGGSFMPAFGDAMVESLRVPIGLVPVAIGSTSVREWLPAGTRITRRPTITRNVTDVGPGEWEVSGKIFRSFTERMKQLGPLGFRAVLWHQGESDANQVEKERTLPGDLYEKYLEQLIRVSRNEIGWDAPWFVAQASYHSPADCGSPEIRAAQRALWDAGVALEGPDTDALTGEMRDHNGTGVHLSGKGLREHGRLWAAKVGPWLERQLAREAN